LTPLFWLLASALLLIAFAFILPPLWRQRPVLAADMDGRNIAIAKNRLAELKEQLQTGALSPAQYNEQRTELELALSDDLDISSQTHAASNPSRVTVYALVLVLPLLALGLYADLGDYQAIDAKPEMAANRPAEPSVEDMNKMIAKLVDYQKTHPDNTEGWVMLGKAYKYQQHYPQAAEALAQAYRLLGEQTEIMLLYADALAFANDEQLAGKPAELVFKVLAREPDNITALWYGGMAKAQAGDAVAGITLWRKLITLLPAGSQAQQETQSVLAKLEASVPGGVPAETAAPAATTPAVSLSVQVNLAPELQKSVSPTDTVFVYAQALTGAKMPLAIVRKTVADLPLTVGLTDAMAMMPTMKLSRFTQVKLLARVSKSGNAMTQSGDLLGEIEPVATTATSVNTIVINHLVK
jgi:cytochrome c-type biogenesis protein CcmH